MKNDVSTLIQENKKKVEKLAILRAAIIEGLESGQPRIFDKDEFQKKMLEKLG